MGEAHEHRNVPLNSDGWTEVTRVGNTVRRPVRPFTATVHAFLRHLHDQGFEGAPLPLGYDADGREVLTYIPGEVPVEPVPEWAGGQRNSALTMKAAADADPVFRRWCDDSVKDRLPRAEAWLAENAAALRRTLQ